MNFASQRTSGIVKPINPKNFIQNIDLKKFTNFLFELFQQKEWNALTRFHRQYVNLNKSVPLYTTTTFYQNQMKYDKEALEDYFCLLHIHKA